jgi:hypothetical protein
VLMRMDVGFMSPISLPPTGPVMRLLRTSAIAVRSQLRCQFGNETL